ncbi:MAG: ABC transporter permease [Verrucomicrobia bacterium]|nr:ABC transporter permease [Verrucomicrobiota bacterium]
MMHLPFSLFLSLKYLKPKRTLLSIASVMSVIGVMLGVAVMVIVISVMTGFDDMWRDKILSFNAHLVVRQFGAIDDPENIVGRVERLEGVTGAAPLIQGLVFVQREGQVYTPIARGVLPEQETKVSRIPENIVDGTYYLEDDEIIIGRDLAFQMGVSVGDEVLVYSPQSFASADEFHLPEELTVSGIFELGMWDFDMGYVLTSLETARELYNMEDGVHAVQVMTSDPYHAETTARLISSELGSEYIVQTWMELNHQLFAALRVEKNLMLFILIFIVLVAAFGIASTLINTTYQKTREIGLLKAIGFSSGSIMRVFFWQGCIEGVAGTAAGIGLGRLALHYRNDLLQFLSNRLNLDLLPKELYHLSEIPATTTGTDILLISIVALMICMLAGLLPAMRAAHLDPVRALRYE